MAHQPETQNSLISKVVSFLNQNGYCVWRQENYGRFDSTAAEEQLTKVVLALAANPHISAEQAKKAIRRTLSNSWRIVPDNLKGIADIIGWNMLTGKWIAVEIKIGSDQIRPEQEQFLRRLKNSGGEIYLVREFESFTEGFWRRKQPATQSV